jgi:excisionase family DNA binding protein
MESQKPHRTLYDPRTGSMLLTLKEAAKYLDYHPFSVYKLVSQGVLKPQKIDGRTLVFLQEELDRYRSSNAWAARKASIAHQPEAAQENLPSTMTAAVMVDLGLGPVFPENEQVEDFSWELLPLIRADLNERYGKKMKTFQITVNSPDGWKWHIRLEPPTLIEKLGKKLRNLSKRKRSGSARENEE